MSKNKSKTRKSKEELSDFLKNLLEDMGSNGILDLTIGVAFLGLEKALLLSVEKAPPKAEVEKVRSSPEPPKKAEPEAVKEVGKKLKEQSSPEKAVAPPEEEEVSPPGGDTSEKEKTSSVVEDELSYDVEEEYYEQYANGIKEPKKSAPPANSIIQDDQDWLSLAYVEMEEEKDKKEDQKESVIPWAGEDDRQKALSGTEKPQETTPPVEQEQQQFSVDDWMDIMDGKDSSHQEEAPTATTVATVAEEAGEISGPHLRGEIDYAEKHVIPERLAPRKVKKKEPVREGLKKREEFEEVKLAYKKRFKASTKNPGRLCAVCGAKEKSKQCIVCGKDGAAVMAKLCEKCAGDKKTAFNCLKCGKPNSRVIAKLCEDCAPTYSAVCIKCGENLFK